MNTITIQCKGKKPRTCEVGTAVSELLESPVAESGLPYIAAMVNNDLCSLSYPLTVNSEVAFLTMADAHGWRVYRRSLCFLLGKTIRDLFPKAVFSVDHSFGVGLYCTFSRDAADTEGMTSDVLESIDRHMRELVERDVPIERRKVAYMDAVREFEAAGQAHKLNLLRHRNPPRVVIHWCDGFSDLAHGPLVPCTGVLSNFQLVPYNPGFVLHLPSKETPTVIDPFEDQPHLFQIFQEHKQWGKILGFNTVGRLNKIIARGEIGHYIQTAEALHEKKVARIADQIAAAIEDLRIILIAGPSCAGKTTFSKRLTTHLAVNGLSPVTLSTDNYFVGKDKNPVNEDGTPDYEHVEAVDISLFNEQLSALVEGQKVDLPHYDFENQRRQYRGDTLKIGKGQILIIEGIHALNPRLTNEVPNSSKFRIYVSALTQLSLDPDNRLSTTDNRLMRRIVRDHRYRGHLALETLQLWPGVRRGEKQWIFPYQREADVAFNSALDYELAVLKPLVEPLLMQIKPDQPEYAEARRLSEFLLNFLATSDRYVPRTSILREYIGGSSFQY